MIRSLTLSLAAATGLALAASANTCSTLTTTVTPDATGAVQTLDVAVTGSTADALTLLAFGETLGSTTLGDLTLDLASPFAAVPLGFADASGDIGLSLDLPAAIGITLHAQAVGIDFSFGGGPPGLDYCVSNTSTFSL